MIPHDPMSLILSYPIWIRNGETIMPRRMKLLRSFVLISVAASLACCTSKEQAATTAPPAQSMAQSTAVAPVASGILPGSVQDFQVNVGDTVHFAFNDYEVRESDKPMLQHQAAWLKKYPQITVAVEGNCDERGTREYNLALGARRANAVKEYLMSFGVTAARINTISYGKERPVCTQSSEECWAQNRRGVTAIMSGATTLTARN
jgi:peptidoglycan-associated lipoprotein